jgi:hypothetical protein
VLEALVAKPWMTSRVTAAALMRKLDKEHPTLLLDESDAMFGGDEQYTEALRGALNAGFYRTGKHTVCVGQGANLTWKDFSVFGPKAIAGIGRLPSTVESRSIPITLKRRMRGEAIHKWRRRDGWAEAKTMRDRLASLMKGKLDALKRARPAMPDGLSDRSEDVLEPLFAIADLVGGEWPEPVREAAVSLMGQAARNARESDLNLPLELLTDIQHIFVDLGEPDILPTKTLIEHLVALDDRPWAAFGRSEKPITGHRISRLLKGFDIEPAGKIRLGSETVRGYRSACFVEAFSRYTGFKAEQRNNVNESGPESPLFKAEQDGECSTLKSEVHPDKHWDCSTVPLSTGGIGNSEPACCAGGPLQPKCKLCRQSPTYWERQSN